MKKIFVRQFVKAEDIVLLLKVNKRQAQNHLKKIRESFSKEKGQLVTWAECAKYFSIPVETVEEAVLYNDLPDEEDEFE